MKSKLRALIPTAITACVLGFASLIHLLPETRLFAWFDLFRRLEWMTYDWRQRMTATHAGPAATRFGAVFLDEYTVELIGDGSLGYRAQWPYPRHVHGRLVRELSAQGAKAIAFDILFGELRPKDDPVETGGGSPVDSDAFFAREISKAGNLILAASSGDMGDVVPPSMFATNAWAIGDISSDYDPPGILRRIRPYRDYPEGGRIWHVGLVLAARELDLDLAKAEISPERIVLRNERGIERSIPLDKEGKILIDWSLAWNDPALVSLPYGAVLALGELRQAGRLDEVRALLDGLRRGGKTNLAGDHPFAGKLVVVGSVMKGNNLSDFGPTPLSSGTYLVSKHWNVANMVISGRFITGTSRFGELWLMLALGLAAAWLTWRLRTLWALCSVVLLGAAYVACGTALFVHSRYCLPLVMPVCGGLALPHLGLITYRVVFEQRERRRIKNVFARIVSPSVVNELLGAERLSLGGALRRVTVYFADVRGFTEFTDVGHARAETHVREQKLQGKEAEDYLDQQARDQLETVNRYLGAVADVVKKHDGTLDKYIGDCVMAFWGAPVSNERHAVAAVHAAIDAQRAIFSLNQDRAAENRRREDLNSTHRAAGEAALPMLPLLSLGSGVNTGVVTVGLMGSDSTILNYTVFGRDVNLASRLEGVSGRGRIIIGEATFAEIHNLDPELAATCVELQPVVIKGFRDPIKVYEVPWKQVEPAAVVGDGG